MARVRTFIAVEISEEIRKNAVALQQRLAKADVGVRWATPETIHVTLLFLGEVDDREVVDVCRAVQEVASREPPFPMRVSGVGAFPNTRRPKTIWAGITDGAEQLQRLYGLIEAKLLDLGCYRKEERAYTPHLTLGRVKAEGSGHALAAELPRLMAWDGGQTVVDEVVVFASELTRDGPVYTALGRGELTGKPATGS
ncbi:MAG TPA: RNA 2',3'-cyclic phosphodiesterase [Gemmataceae bacterium]|nr:RNA 2',3'-cyclic phosphodiesterase [Gemmataceae bacterium]